MTLEEVLCALLSSDERCMCWEVRFDVKGHNLGRGKTFASRMGEGEAIAWGIMEGKTLPRLEGGVEQRSRSNCDISSRTTVGFDADF